MNRLLTLFLLFNAVVQAQVKQNALLYEVKGNGAKASYLFGSMHLMDADVFVLQKKLVKTMLSTEVLCMEIADVNGIGLKPDLLTLKSGSIRNYFNTAQLDSILVWAEKSTGMTKGLFLDNFENAKPFLLLQLILQTSLPERTKSYEKELEYVAKKNGVSVNGLETIEDQLNIFAKMPDKLQSEMVMSTIRNYEKSKQTFEKMQRIYLTQNLEELYKFIKNEPDSPLTDSRAFLEDRNIRWIPEMESMMKKNTVFFTVGAAHLAGDEGVIRLLEKKGYKITPIKM
jgi:uncharacterized protein